MLGELLWMLQCFGFEILCCKLVIHEGNDSKVVTAQMLFKLVVITVLVIAESADACIKSVSL